MNDHDNNEMTRTSIDAPDPRFDHGVPCGQESVAEVITCWSRYTSPYVSAKSKDELKTDDMTEFYSDSDMSATNFISKITPPKFPIAVSDEANEANEANKAAQKDDTETEDSPASALEKLIAKMEAIYFQDNVPDITDRQDEKILYPTEIPNSKIYVPGSLDKDDTTDTVADIDTDLNTDTPVNNAVTLEIDRNTTPDADTNSQDNAVEYQVYIEEDTNSDVHTHETVEEEVIETFDDSEDAPEPIEDIKQEQLLISDPVQNLEKQEALRKKISSTPSLREAEKLLEQMEKQPRMSDGAVLESPEDTRQNQPDQGETN